MSCFPQVHLLGLGYDRHAGHEVQRRLCLGDEEVHFSDALRSVQQVRHIRPQPVAELVQYPGDFSGLREMELADFIGNLHYFSWLDESGLSGRGLVIDESLYLSLVGSAYWNQHFSVPDDD